jgi:hypothetical protein
LNASDCWRIPLAHLLLQKSKWPTQTPTADVEWLHNLIVHANDPTQLNFAAILMVGMPQKSIRLVLKKVGVPLLVTLLGKFCWIRSANTSNAVLVVVRDRLTKSALKALGDTAVLAFLQTLAIVKPVHCSASVVHIGHALLASVDRSVAETLRVSWVPSLSPAIWAKMFARFSVPVEGRFNCDELDVADPKRYADAALIELVCFKIFTAQELICYLDGHSITHLNQDLIDE